MIFYLYELLHTLDFLIKHKKQIRKTLRRVFTANNYFNDDAGYLHFYNLIIPSSAQIAGNSTWRIESEKLLGHKSGG